MCKNEIRGVSWSRLLQVLPRLPFLADACVALLRCCCHHLNRLSELEKELKETLEKKSAELGTAERRLVDITEALRSQKQLRMKEMLENQVKKNTICAIPGTTKISLPARTFFLQLSCFWL